MEIVGGKDSFFTAQFAGCHGGGQPLSKDRQGVTILEVFLNNLRAGIVTVFCNNSDEFVEIASWVCPGGYQYPHYLDPAMAQGPS